MAKRARLKLSLLIGYTYRMKRKKTLFYFIYLHTLGFKLTECIYVIGHRFPPNLFGGNAANKDSYHLKKETLKPHDPF